MSGELDPRKRLILRAVILEYVAEGEPVGSEFIAQKYELGVRSATVRNELAEISELGYLEQPHTSAGRIPSDTGYRYYVDHMLQDQELDEPSRKRMSEVAERAEILRSLLQDTTKALSRMTMQLVAATTVGDVHLKVRNAVLTALGPQSALLVLIFNNGDVENRLIECPAGVTLEDFGRVNEMLTSLLSGMNANALSKLKAPGASGQATFDRLVHAAIQTAKQVGKELSKGQLIVEGEEYIFAQPDLQRDAQALRDVLRQIEDEESLLTALQNPSGKPLLVTIGREHDAPGLRALSILRHDFYIGDEEAGTLAIIGPTRQDYQTGISLLQYTARAISETLKKILPS